MGPETSHPVAMLGRGARGAGIYTAAPTSRARFQKKCIILLVVKTNFLLKISFKIILQKSTGGDNAKSVGDE